MPTYYHVTAKKAWKNIQMEGLKPGQDGVAGPGIYMASSIESAQRRSRNNGSIILEVETDGYPNKCAGGKGNYVVYDPQKIVNVTRYGQ